MTVFEHKDFDKHEQVLFCSDPSADLHAIIAIHNSNLGPAAGGCRMHPYPSTEAALEDALRLSKGMSYKNALSGLPLGGGKSVIIADPSDSRKRERLQAFAKFVQKLGGQYWTAIDIGVGLDDVAFMAQHCDYVFALIDEEKGRGDTSYYTSLGGYVSLKAAAEHAFNTRDMRGMKVAVQGVGKTGSFLCELLHVDGAELVVTDVREDAVKAVVDRFGAKAVKPEEIYAQDVDVFAPCALGAVINDESLAQLKAKVICGLANNQLAEPRHGEMLREKGILYAPDYIANAGGMLYASEDIFDSNNQERSMQRIHGLKDTLREVFARADAEGVSTDIIADKLAEERMQIVQAQ